MQGTAVRIHTLKTAETMTMLAKHFNTNPTQQTQKGTPLSLQGEPHTVTHPKARRAPAPATCHRTRTQTLASKTQYRSTQTPVSKQKYPQKPPHQTSQLF